MWALRQTISALFAFVVAVQPGLASDVTIRFQREVTVEKPFIYLGDIAEITTSDGTNLQPYQSAKLRPAPPNGGQLLLDFDTIRTRLSALGLSGSHIEFAGASQVLVRSVPFDSQPEAPQHPLSPDEQPLSLTPAQTSHAKRIIQNVVRNNMMKQPNLLQIDERQIEVYLEDRAISTLATSHPSDWQIQTWTPPQAGVSHLVLVPNPQTPGPDGAVVECDIQMPPLVLTVRQPVSIGETLQATDLIWMYARQSSAVSRPQAVIGMETKRHLRPGTPIQDDDLQKKPLVRPRDIVSVSARHGGITVKTTMRALQGGGLGDTVPLVSLSGKERITARIIDYHETEVIDSPN